VKYTLREARMTALNDTTRLVSNHHHGDRPRRGMPLLPNHHRCAADHRHLPKVQAWSYTRGTDWAITTVNHPQPYFDRLAATVEQLGATRSVLWQLIRLSGDAPLARMGGQPLRGGRPPDR
jgi:hypothetical protein